MPEPVLSHGGLCAGEPGGYQAACEASRQGEKRIKAGFKTCQFLTEDRMCGVYEARPNDCRGYVCWNQDDETVYDYAVFLQKPVATLRTAEQLTKK